MRVLIKFQGFKNLQISPEFTMDVDPAETIEAITTRLEQISGVPAAKSLRDNGTHSRQSFRQFQETRQKRECFRPRVAKWFNTHGFHSHWPTTGFIFRHCGCNTTTTGTTTQEPRRLRGQGGIPSICIRTHQIRRHHGSDGRQGKQEEQDDTAVRRRRVCQRSGVAQNGIQKQRQVVLCAVRETASCGQYPSPNTLRAAFRQKQVWLLRVVTQRVCFFDCTAKT